MRSTCAAEGIIRADCVAGPAASTASAFSFDDEQAAPSSATAAISASVLFNMSNLLVVL